MNNPTKRSIENVVRRSRKEVTEGTAETKLKKRRATKQEAQRSNRCRLRCYCRFVIIKKNGFVAVRGSRFSQYQRDCERPLFGTLLSNSNWKQYSVEETTKFVD